jgi:Domain of unknown function (DUF5659)
MKETTALNQSFATDHLYLAAFLVCRGHSLVGTEPNRNGRINFIFRSSTEVRSAAGEFLSGGQVEARQFAFCVLQLKRELSRDTLRTVERVQYARPRRQS